MPDSPLFFLREKATLDALDALSSADELVLYCGAGVSIDRTGLSWTRLLQQVFEEAARHGRPHRERQLKAIDFLLSHLSEEEQRASVITEYFTEGKPEVANDLLTSILQRVLYEDNGWSEGSLLANLARLALVASQRLRKVTVITTNYDVYLEEEFSTAVKEIAARGGDEIPGLERLVSPEQPSDDEWTVQEMIAPIGTEAMVRIVYLHGRVARPGQPTEGTIVLDEFSYARSHAAVTRVLREYLTDSAMLAAGASVTDAPLVQALALTKTADSITRRFALIPSAAALDPSTYNTGYVAVGGVEKELTQKDVDEMVGGRGAHLGIHLLHPLSHAQTAQFVKELDLAIRLHRSPSTRRYRDVSTGISYEARLASWIDEWGTNSPTPHAAYETLVRALHDDISVILGGTAVENQSLRLETWVRINPTARNRTLTLYANSTGPLHDQHILRREEVRADAPNASISTFLQGRPQLLALDELGLRENDASRWKTFFCVPLSLLIERAVDGAPYAASVPTGVITLAGLEDAHLMDRFHGLSLDDIDRLKEAMTAAGTQVLRPRP
ncbi:hypothetical protein GRS96_08925 [Rathayibacter sp. VKM Ac-2803]|uniref:SIR2 family protein n=1 Tax=Rathayibacter sp. VKM Ac-2803 TaxID=2609256 RepID=UPI00135A9E65|nr:SIR2 family protein [Rathayibacter sp. VKM Ac-2803]MWV49395.1 hypothetical protein [Rathayibacter sp. VKM Ac-2803]